MEQLPHRLWEFEKVNFVIESWCQPCNAPWYIYIQTLKPALLAAFITLISFGWDDVLRGYARPPGTGRRTGKRKGKRRGAKPLRFPELGEMIGDKLPGSSAAKEANWSNGAKTLWRIDSVMQLGLFAWLVADVTEDFAFNWTSALYETRWCQASGLGRFSWQKGLSEIISPGVWNEVAYSDKDYQFPFPNWIVTWGNTGAKGASIGFSLDIEPLIPGAPPLSYTMQLVDIDTWQVYGEDGPTLPDPDGKAVAIVMADVPRNVRFGVRVFCDGAWGLATDGAVFGIEDML